MSTATSNGLGTVASKYSVEETLRRLENLLEEKGVKVFACIDHSGEAEKAGLQMRATKVLIFGSPKAGTPVMQATPSIAIDLPLKALVAEDAQGKVWITYNEPAYLQARHHFPDSLLPNLAGAIALLQKAAE
jgi:uncharacterized protein (DUF302 family)